MARKSKMPTPAERPDLYDYFDYRELPDGYQTGVRLPERLQKLLDDDKARKIAKHSDKDSDQI